MLRGFQDHLQVTRIYTLTQINQLIRPFIRYPKRCLVPHDFLTSALRRLHMHTEKKIRLSVVGYYMGEIEK